MKRNPSVCDCNSGNDCYYVSSIDPNIMPTNTPIDVSYELLIDIFINIYFLKVNITGYFSGSASKLYCRLTNQRDGTELLFEAKLLNITSMECKLNFTQGLRKCQLFEQSIYFDSISLN